MKGEKMTISWTRMVTRPANEQDVAEQNDWIREHPGTQSIPYVLGEEIEIEETIELPGKYDVCDRCQGKGTHVNPNIDGHGMTMDEFYGPDWDDEEREMYLTGGYDVCCYDCGGKRVTLVLDEDACDKKLLEQYYEYLDEKAREDYADRRMRWAEDGYRGSLDDY